MRVGPDGLLVCEPVEPLTVPLFRTLLAGGRPFRVKADYRGLPVPVDELDVVHLVPARRAALPAGTLVLHAAGDGFLFGWTPRATASEDADVARVVAVERLGRLIRFDSRRWRLIGRLVSQSSVAAAALAAWCRTVTPLAARLFRSGPLPIALDSPDALLAGVEDKRGAPAEVVYAAKRAPAGLEPEEVDIFERVGGPRGHVLVVACGAGREVLGLARRGYTVTGIDSVPSLVDAARAVAEREGVKVRLETRAIDAPWSASDAFDLVWCPPLSYEQIPGRDRRTAWLRRLAAVLRAEGSLVMLPACRRDRGPRRGTVDGVRWLLQRVAGARFTTEPGDRLVRHLSLASDPERPCFVHVFQSPREIEREIRAAGLRGRLDASGAWIVTGPHA